MIKIKRTLYIDRLEELDITNFGVHFTSNMNYSHNGGGSNGLTEEKIIEVDAYVSEYIVNEEATKISNEEYPNENEVILKQNQELVVNLRIFGGTMEHGKIVRYMKDFSNRTIKVNTGNRADEWVKNLKQKNL